MSIRRLVAAVLALVVLAGLGFAAWRLLERAPAPPTSRETGAALRPAPSGAPPEPAPVAPRAAPPAEPEPSPGLAGVDLEAVQAALPDNLYWQTSAPSDDPRVLEEREREKAFRNEQYGKVLSGTATDEEILDYYDHRMRASTDYLQFVDYLLEHYGSDLTDQDQTLLHVAKRLQLARLEEIPRRIQEARERKAQQDEARRAWREEQEAFEADAGGAP